MDNPFVLPGAVQMGKTVEGKNIKDVVEETKFSNGNKPSLSMALGAKVMDNKESNDSFSSMSEFELFALEELLKSRAEYCKNTKGKYDFRQIRQILPIDEWLGDEYYVPFTKSIYPYWKELIIKIFEGQEFDNHSINYNEVVAGGSIGIGKSTLAAVLIMRVLYVLSCFENIQSFYGLMPGSPLYIVIISVNREVAEATLYGDLKTKLDMSDYFLEHFPRNQRINSLMAFPNDITIIFGSNINSVIGKNVICFACDEAGFRRESADDTNRFYAYLLARNKSRFIHSGGKDGSLAILLSSATTSTSIVEQRKTESLLNPRIVAVDPKLWEVKSLAYSKHRFPVFTGTSTSDPCVINNMNDLRKILSEEGVHMDTSTNGFTCIQEEWNYILYDLRHRLPDFISSALIEVPVELRSDFKSNLIGSMQDLAGVAVSPSSKLFTSKKVYNSCLIDNYYPFSQNKLKLTTTDRETILDFMKSDARWRIQDPTSPRFIHIDSSFAGDTDKREADHAGIACVRISGVIKSITGEFLPEIEVDYLLEVESPDAPSKTSFDKILGVIFATENYLNMNVKQGCTSFDTFQSEHSVQILQTNGYKSIKLSVDRSDAAYLDLVKMMYEGRIKFKNHPTFLRELFDLIHFRDGRKVDHPVGGSKDLADALCGAVQSALRSDYLKGLTSNMVSTKDDFIDADSFLMEQDNIARKNKIENKDVSDYVLDNLVHRLYY